MKKYDLSDTEKKVLRGLGTPQYKDDMFSDLSQEELYVASKNLDEYGLIRAAYVEGGGIVDMRILDEGVVYLKENPLLENPVDENELKRLQKDELEYRKRIRTQEDIIRLWQLLTALAGIVGIIGWTLFVLFK